VPTRLADFSALTSNRSGDRTLAGGDALVRLGRQPHVHRRGPALCRAVAGDEDVFDRRYNIGAWAWELQRFPARWYDRFAYYDEIWVGSSFIASAIAPICADPGHSHSAGHGAAMAGRRRIGWLEAAARRVPVPVHVRRAQPPGAQEPAGDRRGVPTRVPPVRAGSPDLKCVNAESDPVGFRPWWIVPAGPRSTFTPLRLGEALAVYGSCDAYVSLHRSEGIGLTDRDAMGLGKTGDRDRMVRQHRFHGRVQRRSRWATGWSTLEENVGPYHAGRSVGEPSVEHAAD
jgi:hypothetical protein